MLGCSKNKQENPCLSPVKGEQFMPCSSGIPPQHAIYTGINCPDVEGQDNLLVSGRKCYKCDGGYVYGGPTIAKNECVPKAP